MPAFRVYIVAIERNEPLRSILKRVFDAVDAVGCGEAPVRFFLEGYGPVAEAQSRYPELAPFGIGPALSNFDRSWGILNPQGAGRPLSRGTLLDLVDDGFASVSIVVGPVPWINGLAPKEVPRKRPPPGSASFDPRFPLLTYLGDAIILQRGPTSGARLAVMATEEAISSSRLQQALQALGAVSAEQRIEAEEIAVVQRAVPPGLQAREITQRYRELMAHVPLPHQLPPRLQLRGQAHKPLGQVKVLMARVWAPLGFAPGRARNGLYDFEKRTAAGGELRLDCDLAPIARTIIATLSLTTPEGTFRLPLAPNGRPEDQQYPVPTSEIFRDVLENIGALVAHLEKTWVAEVEKAISEHPLSQ